MFLVKKYLSSPLCFFCFFCFFILFSLCLPEMKAGGITVSENPQIKSNSQIKDNTYMNNNGQVENISATDDPTESPAESNDNNNGNKKYYVGSNPASVNALPDLDLKKDERGRATSNNKTNRLTAFNSARIAGELSEISKEIQAQSELKHGKNTKNILKHKAVQEGVSYGSSQLSSFLNHYGNTKLNVNLQDDLSLDSLSFDYLFPFYVSKQTIGFTQVGYHDWDKRHLLDTGLGYRALNDNYMWGFNVFLDKDMTLGYRRLSLGFELGKDYFFSYGNYYFPISTWHAIDKVGLSLESSPVDGWDIGIKTVFPFCPALSASAGYFQWYGHHVDFLGGFHEHVSAKKYRDLAIDNPWGFDLSLEYSPVPLISAAVSEKVGENSVNDFRISLNLNVSFDQSLSEQLRARSLSRHMLNSLERFFVERNQHVVLDYREDPVFQKSITVLLGSVYEVGEQQAMTLSPGVTTAFPVHSYLWEGDGAQFLSQNNIRHPVFTAPFWAGLGVGKSEYGLSLTAVDELGRSYTAHTTVKVKKDTGLDPDVLFYTDSQGSAEVSSYSVGFRELAKAPTIYWHMFSKRSANASTGFQWGGDIGVLVDPTAQYPTVNPAAPIGHYVLDLDVTSAGDGVSRVSIPVEIYSGSGRRLKAGDDVVMEYSPGATFNQAATGIDSAADITYDSSDTNVATVDNVGEVTVAGAGVTTITVTEAPGSNFSGDRDSYQLTVTKAGTDLDWGTPISSHTVANGQVLAKVADVTVNIPVEYTVGGTTITYSLEDDTTTGATISGSEVTINGTGTVKVVATQVTDTNYLETVISYDLVIGKTLLTDLDWAMSAVTTIVYDPANNASADTPTASSVLSDGTVSYSSSNTRVATIDDTTGVITVNSVGDTIISASITPSADGAYTGQRIEYNLTVDPAVAAAPLSFPATTVEHNFGDPNFTVTAMSAIDADGVIDYSNGGADTVATVDSVSGEVTIVGEGSATITATQAAGTNYPEGTASYTLNVNAIPSDLAWDTPSAAAAGIVTMTMGDAPLTITAVGNSSAGTIAYAIADPIATLSGTSGTPTLDPVAPGSTTVTATQLANGNHVETIVTFTLVVNSVVQSDLSWGTSGSHPVTDGLVVVELDRDTTFTNTAASVDNTTGVIVYSIVGEDTGFINDIATIDEDSGQVTLGDRAGVVTVVATQAASTDGAYGETRIQYLLQVNLNPAPHFDWSNVTPVSPVKIVVGSGASLTFPAYSSNSSGAVTYSSSNPDVAVMTDVGQLIIGGIPGFSTITVHLAADTHFASAELSYNVEATTFYIPPGTLFRWSTGIASGDSMSINYGETPPQITAIAGNPSAVISYSSDNAAVDVSNTGALTVNSITTAPVTITASVPVFSIYPSMSITYLLTVNAADSNLSWDNVMPFGGTRTLAYGESPAVTASGSDSAGAITYSATGAVSITSDTGVITTESIGAATITATQAAAGNFAETTVTSTVTVVAAPVELLWSEADAISGTVSTSFDAASYRSTVTAGGGVPGVTTYSVDPVSAQDVVTVDNDSGLVTFNKAGQVGIIATFTPDEQTHAISTTGYNLIIGKGDGLLLFAGNDRKENYAPNGKFTQAAQNVDPGTVITYQSTDDKVATVAEDGEVTIKGVGTVRIVVTELPSDQFRREQSSYLLTVVAVNTDLTWDDASGDIKNGQVATEVAAGTVDIPAVTTLGTGAVDYSIVGDTSIAELSSATSSTVTVKTAGIVKVVAIQTADDNYLETSISYTLIVGKSLPDFTWTLEPSFIKYSPGGTEKATAVSAWSDGDITYASSNTRVAEINSTTGDITVYGAGTATIAAQITPSGDGRYLAEKIEYTLTVTQADANDTLSFHGVDAGGSITRKFGEADFVIAAVSTDDSDGIITYESDDPNIATVNLDTGVISIQAAGTVTIRARQASGTNYPAGEVSFSLIIDPVSDTMTWNIPADISSVGGAHILPYGKSPALTARGSNSGGVITYSATGAVGITTDTGIITTESIGAATITAIQAAADNFAETTVEFNLTVVAAPVDLLWSETDAAGGTVSTSFDAGSYQSTVTVAGGIPGVTTYSVDPASAQDVVTVGSNSGLVTFSKAGQVRIIATFTPDEQTHAISTTDYDLVIGKGEGLLLFAGDDRTENYAPNGKFTQAAQNVDPGAVITYQSTDDKVATVAEDGEVTIKGVGMARIVVTELPSDQFRQKQSSYSLTVVAVYTDLDWNNASGDINNGRVITEVSTGAVDIPAAVTLGTGAVHYEVEGDSSIAEIISADSSAVTIKTSGIVKVVAIQTADDNYLETSISYTLVIRKSLPDFAWTLEPSSIKYSRGGTEKATAVSNESDGNVIYASSNTRVAEINSTTGDITVYGAGTTTIAAQITPSGDGRYLAEKIEYTLTVTQADANDTLSFHGVDAGGSITRKFGEADFVIAAVSTGDSDGIITYESDDPNIATVNLDTGVISIQAAGTVTIRARQASGTNYPAGEVSFSLIIDPVSDTMTWNIPADISSVGGAHILPYGKSPALTARGSNIGGVITYSATGAVSITTDTGIITTESIGAATITAIQAAADNFAETTVEFNLTVVAAPVDLLWSETDAAGGTVSTSFDAGSYQSTVTVAGGIPGVTTYSVDPASAQDVVTVGSDSGLVTFSKAGQVRIIATFTPDEQTHAISTTDYDLVIGKGEGLLLFAGDDRTENYAPNGKFTQAAQNVDPGAVITYQSTDDKVATVAEDGEVTIKGVGTARIVVTELPSDQFRQKQSSYSLTVVAVYTDLDWNNASGDINNGRVITEVSTGAVDIPAAVTLGTGAVHYEVEGDSSIAEIISADSSAVTIKTSGIVKVVAIQTADDNYLETSISYTLVIRKSLPDFAWTLEPSSIKYSRGGTEKATAVSNESNGNVTYASSNTRVAEINSTTGDITVYGAGTTTIAAQITPSGDGRYLAEKIEYTLTVTQADANDTLSFHGVDAGGSITRKFGEADFVIAAVSTGDSDGIITYESDDPNIATVNLDTGVISINAAGTVTIRAQQAAGTNYPSGEISFDLIIDPVPATITWDMPVDALNGVVVSTVGDMPFTTTATSNAAGATVTYTSSNENVATVSGDQVTVKSVGIAMITAHYPEAGNYTATDASYVLVVTATK